MVLMAMLITDWLVKTYILHTSRIYMDTISIYEYLIHPFPLLLITSRGACTLLDYTLVTGYSLSTVTAEEPERGGKDFRNRQAVIVITI